MPLIKIRICKIKQKNGHQEISIEKCNDEKTIEVEKKVTTNGISHKDEKRNGIKNKHENGVEERNGHKNDIENGEVIKNGHQKNGEDDKVKQKNIINKKDQLLIKYINKSTLASDHIFTS